MKRILEIFGEPISRGGQESFVMSALHNMDLSGLDVDFFTPYYCNNSAIKQFSERNNGHIFAAGIPFTPGKSRINVIKALRDFLDSRNYDVAHIHSGSITALAYCAKAAAEAGIKKVIVHSHSTGLKNNFLHKIIRGYATPFLKKYATDYCACSIEAAKWKFPASVISKVKIINNGVDKDYYTYDAQIRNRMRQEYNVDEDTFIIGHVGRFTFEKNQSFLIDLFDYYIKSHKDVKAKLVLLGEGDEKEQVMKKTEERGIKEDVIFPTKYDKVRDFLQMFDVFVFPSLYEGLGIVGIEAQAAGLPVIASTGVPRTMKITDKVEFISLQSIEAWCKTLDLFKGVARQDTSDQIKGAGFDISDTAKEVRMLYIDSSR